VSIPGDRRDKRRIIVMQKNERGNMVYQQRGGYAAAGAKSDSIQTEGKVSGLVCLEENTGNTAAYKFRCQKPLSWPKNKVNDKEQELIRRKSKNPN